jgi:very-short-patch-repair endonuclease
VVPNHFARHLRRNATGAERILWQQLRLLKPEGYHFRRQVPIGDYIADFACYRKKCIIIELDGGQHSFPDREAGDKARTADLCARGFKIIRFWNVDVFTNLEGVVDQIRWELGLQ